MRCVVINIAVEPYSSAAVTCCSYTVVVSRLLLSMVGYVCCWCVVIVIVIQTARITTANLRRRHYSSCCSSFPPPSLDLSSFIVLPSFSLPTTNDCRHTSLSCCSCSSPSVVSLSSQAAHPISSRQHKQLCYYLPTPHTTHQWHQHTNRSCVPAPYSYPVTSLLRLSALNASTDQYEQNHKQDYGQEKQPATVGGVSEVAVGRDGSDSVGGVDGVGIGCVYSGYGVIDKQAQQLEEIKQYLWERLRYVEPTLGLGLSQQTNQNMKQLVRDLEVHSVSHSPRFPQDLKACQGLWRFQYSSALSPIDFKFLQAGPAAASLRPLNIYQNIHNIGTSCSRLDNVLEFMFPSILSNLPFFNTPLPSLVLSYNCTVDTESSDRARLHIAHDHTTILPHRYLPYALKKNQSTTNHNRPTPSPSSIDADTHTAPPSPRSPHSDTSHDSSSWPNLSWLSSTLSGYTGVAQWLSGRLGAVNIPYGVSNLPVGGSGKFYRTFDTIYVDERLRITKSLQGDIEIFTRITADDIKNTKIDEK
eukprot:GHVS01105353.1.p1 GENE.GHVS01105353.1~~GHVS01105353.1.p1  ORF type:complete len:529 (-),score=75.68 GHVS01105353.1:143-1729(-)